MYLNARLGFLSLQKVHAFPLMPKFLKLHEQISIKKPIKITLLHLVRFEKQENFKCISIKKLVSKKYLERTKSF